MNLDRMRRYVVARKVDQCRRRHRSVTTLYGGDLTEISLTPHGFETGIANPRFRRDCLRCGRRDL